MKKYIELKKEYLQKLTEMNNKEGLKREYIATKKLIEHYSIELLSSIDFIDKGTINTKKEQEKEILGFISLLLNKLKQNN